MRTKRKHTVAGDKGCLVLLAPQELKRCLNAMHILHE